MLPPNQNLLRAAPFVTDLISLVSFVLQLTKKPTSLCDAFINDAFYVAGSSEVNFPRRKRLLDSWAERIRLDRLLRASRTSSLTSLAGVFSLSTKQQWVTAGFCLFVAWIVLFMTTGDEMNWTQLSDSDVSKRKLRAGIGFAVFVTISILVKAWQL
jgi:hypothetical protein